MFPLLAAAIIFVQNAPAHTVFYFDNQIQVTQRVLAGTIHADVERVQDCLQSGSGGLIDGQNVQCIARVKRHQEALNQHCQVRLTADGYVDASVCGKGTR